MNNFLEGAIFGAALMIGGLLIIDLCVDYSFGFVEEMYASSVERCEKLGSKPVSVDSSTVTCENGIEVNWR